MNAVPSRSPPVTRSPDATLKWEPARRPFRRRHLRKAVGTQRPLPQRQGNTKRCRFTYRTSSKTRRERRKERWDMRDPTGKTKRAARLQPQHLGYTHRVFHIISSCNQADFRGQSHSHSPTSIPVRHGGRGDSPDWHPGHRPLHQFSPLPRFSGCD